MLHLLKLEWLKQKKFIVFRVMAILYLVALPSLLLVWKNVKVDADNLPPFLPSMDSLYMFPYVWQFLGYIGNWLTFFFLGFLSVLMVTNEFNHKTLRQNIITGLSRTEYFTSKIVFILFISLCATTYYTLWCLILGFTHNDTIYLSTVLKNSDYIYRYFLMGVGYMSIGLFIGLLIRRTGIALFLYLAYAAILEPILRWGFHMNVLNKFTGIESIPQTMHYYPMNALDDLVPIPFADIAEGFAESNGFNFLLSPFEAILFASMYTLLFLGLSFWNLQGRDL